MRSTSPQTSEHRLSNFSFWNLSGVWSSVFGIFLLCAASWAGGRVYLFSLNGATEMLTAFDANSGKIVWNVEGGWGWPYAYPGTRATPTTSMTATFIT